MLLVHLIKFMTATNDMVRCQCVDECEGICNGFPYAILDTNNVSARDCNKCTSLIYPDWCTSMYAIKIQTS